VAAGCGGIPDDTMADRSGQILILLKRLFGADPFMAPLKHGKLIHKISFDRQLSCSAHTAAWTLAGTLQQISSIF